MTVLEEFLILLIIRESALAVAYDKCRDTYFVLALARLQTDYYGSNL